MIASGEISGYPCVMAKILVSIDDKLLRRIDRVAKASGLSRSAYLSRIAARDVGAERGPGADPRARRGDYQAGRLAVVVPALLFLELLNVAGRRWGWGELALGELAGALDDLLFEVAEPELAGVAAWVARGLTAYDAACVALAEERAVPLVTDDEAIVKG